MSNNENEQKLARNLKPINVWALALGSIIGWGAFVMPGNTFLPNAGPLGTAIAMTIAALIMISIAFNYSYMINRFPVAGGEYVYTKESFGKIMGFICAWFLGLSYLAIVPLNATALALIGRNLFPAVFQWGHLYTVEGYGIYLGEVLLAVVALVLFAFLCIRGVGVAGKFQTFLAFALVGCVLLLGIAALISPAATIENLTPAFQQTASGDINIGGIVAVIAVAPWAFVGFDSIPQASEEFNFSPKKSKIIMVLSILFGGLLYIVLNTITAAVVPDGYANWTEYIAAAGSLEGIKSMPTFNAAETLLGIPGLIILSIALFCAVLSGMIGFYMATSRLLYSIAKDNVLPSAFAKLHPKYKTPYVAILFVMGISLIAPWFGREVLGWIVDMSSIGAAIGYAFTSAATFMTIRKYRDAGAGLKINSVIGTLFSLAFVVMLLSPKEWGYGGLGIQSRIALVVWCVLGVVMFVVSHFKKKKA
ncbi:MAG: APC family permease [Oscillospiraceae bacterium]|nr:APC family permease [Oscillospiraceae bacterium]